MDDHSRPLTKSEARKLLQQAREDVALLLQRRTEDLEECYRLLTITGTLHLAILGEEAPEFRLTAQLEVAS